MLMRYFAKLKQSNMIHIATVHWQSEHWIDVQLDYLARNISEPFRVYAWLNDVPGDYRRKFHYVNTEPVSDHAVKLNILADLIYFDSNRHDDLIIFLDGDAFPIGDVISFARKKLEKEPLVAVQRLENDGDLQPHPCFCVATVGFWKRIGGDWKSGYKWDNSQGKPVTDVGGNLLGLLRREKVDWHPMLRSNRINLHPLWFGIYEGLIYHHGAAFRHPLSRIDSQKARADARGTWRWPLVVTLNRLAGTYPGSERRLWQRGLWLFNPLRSLEKQAAQRNRDLINRVFKGLRNDPEFYREFI
jgi:hypothetical protein